MTDPLIRHIGTRSVISKTDLPVCDYAANPYVGCTHACGYCYASFMKRFTGHPEPWGTFLDVKHWPEIRDPSKYAGTEIFIGSVTDPYNPQEAEFGRTRELLEQLRGSGAKLSIATKSDLRSRVMVDQHAGRVLPRGHGLRRDHREEVGGDEEVP